MKYFAIIDDEQRGPYELSELVEAGVRPATYVWCKGMEDWERADEVADICRMFRQRIFDLMHPQSRPKVNAPTADGSDALNTNAAADDEYSEVPLRFRGMVRRSGVEPPSVAHDEPDTSRMPSPTLFISVMLTLFCFPITGAVAIYYSYLSRAAWEESQRSNSKSSNMLYSEEERENYRRMAHDYTRQAKMWIGITFFLGMILFAFIGKKFF